MTFRFSAAMHHRCVSGFLYRKRTKITFLRRARVQWQSSTEAFPCANKCVPKGNTFPRLHSK